GGSGDAVSADVVVEDGERSYRRDGSAFVHFNAGANTSRGELPAPSVVQGSASTDWGEGAAQSALHDLEAVRLAYSGLSGDRRYRLFAAYYNADDAAGGNVQRLVDGAGRRVHGEVSVPADRPLTFGGRLPASSVADTGELSLTWQRESGYRAAVSQVWLLAEGSGDTGSATLSITAPAAGSALTGGQTTITGEADAGDGARIVAVEVGVDAGNGPQWRPVSRLNADGRWRYRWTLPADGEYTLTARATDAAGNTHVLGEGVMVTVDQSAPAPVSAAAAHDTPADTGGSLTLEWQRSGDDGAGADDVTGYALERRGAEAGDFTALASVAAGVEGYEDTSVETGSAYVYRVVAIDRAGNRTSSGEIGPARALDNSAADETPPEEVTGLSARAGNERVTLRWTPSADSEGDQVDVLLDISADGGASWGTNAPAYDDGGAQRLSKEANHYVVDGLTNGQSYRFRLRTRDAASPANVSAGVTTGEVTPSATAYTTVSGTL
ncbi:Ig-like domain-containing protein, partial [Arhodomonas sp. AD133]|uniref:Ig-like domain-containing protein n=1 Tax=Arhodomonas sp. AD133 TaxID=3415009 RepID=UPI003EBC6952